MYDPLFSITPQIIHNITPQQSSLGGGGASGTTTTTIFNFSPSLTKNFERDGGNYTLSFANSRQTTNNSTFSSLSPFYSSNLSLQFNQPLFRNRSHRCQSPLDQDSEEVHSANRFGFSAANDSDYFAGAGRLLEPGVRAAQSAEPARESERRAAEHAQHRSAD